MNWDKRIKEVDWTNYITTYRNADEFPHLLIQLTKPLQPEQLEEVFEELRVRLDGHLSGAQNYKFEQHAASVTLPILIDMLADKNNPHRIDIFEFVHGFFISKTSYGTLPHHYRDAVWQQYQPAFTTFLQLLEDYSQVKETKSFIMNALCSRQFFTDKQTLIIADIVCDIMLSENDVDVQINAILNLGNLFIYSRNAMKPDQSKILEKLPNRELIENDKLHIALLFAEAVIRGDNMSDGLLNLLVEQLLLPSKAPKHKQQEWSILMPDTEWLFGRFPEELLLTPSKSRAWYYAGLALSQLALGRRIAVYKILLSKVQYPSRAVQFAFTLLDQVFDIALGPNLRSFFGELETTDDGEIRYFFYVDKRLSGDLNALTNEQKLALQVVIDSDKVWEIPHNLLARYGFSPDREIVRQQLG